MASSTQFQAIDALFTPQLWDEPTAKTPVIQVAPKRRHTFINAWLCIALVGVGLFIGIGMGKTVMAGQANIVTYCTGNVCVQKYNDTCSDWWQIQNGNKP